eukprot:2474369-Lingulodinium_polyedra.AAC.1
MCIRDRACRAQARDLRAAAEALNDTASPTTLLALCQQALQALSPKGCEEGGQMHEDGLRAAFGSGRPVLRLEGLAEHCELLQGDTVEEDAALARLLARESAD